VQEKSHNFFIFFIKKDKKPQEGKPRQILPTPRSRLASALSGVLLGKSFCIAKILKELRTTYGRKQFSRYRNRVAPLCGVPNKPREACCLYSSATACP
jgi:hypothetical protein